MQYYRDICQKVIHCYTLLVITEFENVYEPAEDSFILLDAIEIEIKKIQELKPTFAVEIGPGSGIISAALANLPVNDKLSQKLCFVFSCDINLLACQATQLTAHQNNVSSNIAVVCSNLFGGLIYRCKETIDLGKFNDIYCMYSTRCKGVYLLLYLHSE